MIRSILLSLAVLLLASDTLSGCQSVPDHYIVWIELSENKTAEDLFALKLGLDVWEVGKKHIVAKINAYSVETLREKGYPTTILYKSEEEYTSSIERGENPLRVARINCATDLECEEIVHSNDISGLLESHEKLLIVKVTGEQLASLLEKSYDAHLIYATEQEYLYFNRTEESLP